jgi:hypothetical protein
MSGQSRRTETTALRKGAEPRAILRSARASWRCILLFENNREAGYRTANFGVQYISSASRHAPYQGRADGLYDGKCRSCLSEAALAEVGNYIMRALDYVQTISPAMGLLTQAAEFVADSTVQETSSGARAVNLQQRYKGIPIFQAATTVRFAPDGALIDTLDIRLRSANGGNHTIATSPLNRQGEQKSLANPPCPHRNRKVKKCGDARPQNQSEVNSVHPHRSISIMKWSFTAQNAILPEV